MISFKN